MPLTNAMYVYPDAWFEASDADRDAYERRAKERGITLYIQPTGSGGRDVVVLLQDGELVSASFRLPAPCRRRRPGWEHIVRRELGFEDPCLT